MKKLLMLLGLTSLAFAVHSQTYPEPEFTNEVYYLQKDSVYTAIRLEKGTSKLDTKTKMGGLGGSESGYKLEGEKSTVHVPNAGHLSFVFSSGKSQTSTGSSPQRDSMMRANGIDPAVMENMEGMNDPIRMITLYKVEDGKNSRKILLQKNGGATPFASKKPKSSDKFSFSARKIRNGYWELVIDKSLGKGEYAFTFTDMMSMAGGGITYFAFTLE